MGRILDGQDSPRLRIPTASTGSRGSHSTPILRKLFSPLPRIGRRRLLQIGIPVQFSSTAQSRVVGGTMVVTGRSHRQRYVRHRAPSAIPEFHFQTLNGRREPSNLVESRFCVDPQDFRNNLKIKQQSNRNITVIRALNRPDSFKVNKITSTLHMAPTTHPRLINRIRRDRLYNLYMVPRIERPQETPREETLEEAFARLLPPPPPVAITLPKKLSAKKKIVPPPSPSPPPKKRISIAHPYRR